MSDLTRRRRHGRQTEHRDREPHAGNQAPHAHALYGPQTNPTAISRGGIPVTASWACSGSTPCESQRPGQTFSRCAFCVAGRQICRLGPDQLSARDEGYVGVSKHDIDRPWSARCDRDDRDWRQQAVAPGKSSATAGEPPFASPETSETQGQVDRAGPGSCRA